MIAIFVIGAGENACVLLALTAIALRFGLWLVATICGVSRQWHVRQARRLEDHNRAIFFQTDDGMVI